MVNKIIFAIARLLTAFGVYRKATPDMQALKALIADYERVVKYNNDIAKTQREKAASLQRGAQESVDAARSAQSALSILGTLED